MAKIETYVLANQPLSFSDMLIGTEVDGPIPNATKNFSLGELYNLFSSLPMVGNLQQTLDKGNTATQNIILTGKITSTVIKPSNIEDSLGSQGTTFQYLSKNTSGINWVDLPVDNLQAVLNSGNTATQNIILVGNITSTRIIPGNIQDETASIGLAGQVLQKTSSGIRWVNNSIVYTPGLNDVLLVGNSATNNINLTGNFVGTSFIKTGGTNLQYLMADGSVTTGMSYTLPVATSSVLGGVKIGSGVNVLGDGTISVSLENYVPYTGATDNVDINTNSFVANNGLFNTEMSPAYFGVQNAAITKFALLEYDQLNITDNVLSKTMTIKATGLTFPDATIQTTAAITSISATSPITSSGGTTPTISTSMATNKLIGRYSASTGVMEEVSIGSGLTLTGAGVLNNTATPTPTGYYGAFQDNVTQTTAASNVGYAMIFRTIDLSNGISVVTNGTNLTRITFANTGIYNLQFSSQFQNTSNQLADVTIWLRLNGVDVAGSSGFASIPNSHGGVDGHSIVSWNYLLSVVAGEYYELMWSTTDHTHITMQFYAAGSPPPSTASVILTVTQQSGIMAGTGITAINSLTGAAQTIVAGTSGTDFSVSSVGTTHTLNLPTASASNRGALSTTDWSRFDTAYTDRLKWDGGATGLVAATGRTSLGLGTAALVADNTLVHLAGTETITGVKTFNPTVTAATNIARGLTLTGTYTNSTTSDVLVALDIQPTFTNTFTRYKNLGLRIGTSYAPYDTFANALNLSAEINGNAGVSGIMNIGGDSCVMNLWSSGAISNGSRIGATYTSPSFQHLYLGTGTGTKQMIIVGSNGNVIIQNGGTFTDSGDSLQVSGNLNLKSASSKIKINAATPGSASVGTSSAIGTGGIAGRVVVTTSAATTSSKIFLTGINTAVGTATNGELSVGTITNNTSFEINSSNTLDTRTVNWFIIN